MPFLPNKGVGLDFRSSDTIMNEKKSWSNQTLVIFGKLDDTPFDLIDIKSRKFCRANSIVRQEVDD